MTTTDEYGRAACDACEAVFFTTVEEHLDFYHPAPDGWARIDCRTMVRVEPEPFTKTWLAARMGDA